MDQVQSASLTPYPRSVINRLFLRTSPGFLHSVAFPPPFSVAILPLQHKAEPHSVLDVSPLSCLLVYALIIRCGDLRSQATASTGAIPQTLVTNNTKPGRPLPSAALRFSGLPSHAFSSQVEFIVPNLLIGVQMGSFCARGAAEREGRPAGGRRGGSAGPLRRPTLRQARR